MESLGKFYGADWLLFAFVLIHLWLLGHKKRTAFLYGVAACCCGFSFGCMTGSVATLLMNAVFAVMHIRAYILWGKPQKENCDE